MVPVCFAGIRRGQVSGQVIEPSHIAIGTRNSYPVNSFRAADCQLVSSMSKDRRLLRTSTRICSHHGGANRADVTDLRYPRILTRFGNPPGADASVTTSLTQRLALVNFRRSISMPICFREPACFGRVRSHAISHQVLTWSSAAKTQLEL